MTRARLLIREANYEQASAWLRKTESENAEVNDPDLIAELNLVCAIAEARRGDNQEAAARMVASHEAGILTARKLQGKYYLGAAQLLDNKHQELGAQLRSRALEIWKRQGVVADRLEMEHGSPKYDNSGHVCVESGNKQCPLPRSPESLADALASVIDLAHSPALLGFELSRIIEALDCSSQVKIVSGLGSVKAPTRGVVTVNLGTDSQSHSTLVCRIPESPAKAIILADVLRIGRAAVELERARQDERERAAIWPAMPIEEQAGGIFRAEEMQRHLATARRIAPTQVPVLITGETGTGKEVLARTIHLYSTRAAATFLPFNCNGVPKDMLDSQLFGHRRGSFTGATEHFPGVIRATNGGTLFLDEIGELSLDVQPKLLRFLENHEVHPIGDVRPVRADIRLIAATNANLDALVAEGRFREDLFYRLNIVRIHLPPLRERRVEIPELANYYLEKFGLENRRGNLRLAEETMEYLLLYRWPGNVRQLANEMRRLSALAEPGAVLMPEHLSPDIASSRRTVPTDERVLAPTEVVVRTDQTIAAAVQHVEQTMVQNALRASGGRLDDAAAMLGLSRKGLYLKRVRYGMAPPATRGTASV